MCSYVEGDCSRSGFDESCDITCRLCPCAPHSPTSTALCWGVFGGTSSAGGPLRTFLTVHLVICLEVSCSLCFEGLQPPSRTGSDTESRASPGLLKMRFLSPFESATEFSFQLQERRLPDAQSAALLIDISVNVVWSGSFVQLGELSRSALASGDLFAGKHLPRPAQPGGLGTAAFESVLSNSLKGWKQRLHNVQIFFNTSKKEIYLLSNHVSFKLQTWKPEGKCEDVVHILQDYV